MLEFDVPVRTFNIYGGSIGSVAALVELADLDFGSAIDEIEITVNFRSSKPFSKQGVDRSLADGFKEFHNEHLPTLPKRTFYRKKRQLSCDVICDFVSAEEYVKNRNGGYPWQADVLDLVISEMKACKKKLKASDDFRMDEFIAWLEALRPQLPGTLKAFNEVSDRWCEKRVEDHEGKSDWEKLDIDWDDFHPSAREIVADPRLWDTGNEFAPHGNDDGADILAMFMESKSRSKRAEGKTFFRGLARSWDFNAKEPPGETFDYRMRRNATLAVAFAFLKCFAYCPQWLADEATEVINGYGSYLEEVASDWEFLEECLDHLSAMKECLASSPHKT